MKVHANIDKYIKLYQYQEHNNPMIVGTNIQRPALCSARPQLLAILIRLFSNQDFKLITRL